MRNPYDHGYILLTVLFTVYSQLIMRWQVVRAGALPDGYHEKIWFLVQLLVNPWVLSGIVATFFAGLAWMMAMTKFELSYAYPFISLNYVLVFIAGAALFHEAVTAPKLFGVAFIIVGIVILSRG